jgi:predicted nucleic acid-binding protein
LLLDTNAYTALARGLQSIVDVISDRQEISLPLPTIAELRYGFANGSQSERNEGILQKFLSQPQVSIVLPTLKTTEIYASLQLLCQRQGRALSQNDIWIAALARESDDVLVTYDKDFTVFNEVLGKKLLILA